ncbi:MAG: methylamine utilization protein, partial [Dokdonella sp.]
LLILLVLVSGSASAAELKLRVVDADGKSLDDAVASLRPAIGHAPRVIEGTATVMDQRDLQFMPHVLPIQIGTKVSMPNSDQVRHHLYSFSPAKQFELRMYKDRPGDPGDFLIPGIVSLGCNIHDWMLGYIVVLDTPYFAKSGDDGRMVVTSVPNGEYVLDVWHPRLPRSEPISEPITLAPDMTEKTIAMTVEPVEEPAPPSELELRFRRYQANPDAR